MNPTITGIPLIAHVDIVRNEDGATGTGQPSRARRMLRAVASSAVSLLVALIAVVALAVGLVPLLAGGHTLTVLSGSMVPALPVGSIVVERPASAQSLGVGNIVSYATRDEITGVPVIVTHRIISIHHTRFGLQFTTKGDANNVADDKLVVPDQIRGKVWYHVPYVGVAKDYLMRRGSWIILAGAALLAASFWVLSRALRAKRVD